MCELEAEVSQASPVSQLPPEMREVNPLCWSGCDPRRCSPRSSAWDRCARLPSQEFRPGQVSETGLTCGQSDRGPVTATPWKRLSRCPRGAAKSVWVIVHACVHPLGVCLCAVSIRVAAKHASAASLCIQGEKRVLAFLMDKHERGARARQILYQSERRNTSQITHSSAPKLNSYSGRQRTLSAA